MIECKFSLELTKNGIQRSTYAKVGEKNARKLVITLTKNGKVYNLVNHRARICLENGDVFPDELVEIVGDTVQAIIPNSFGIPQVRICELTIMFGNDTIYSPMFELVVEESLGAKAEGESLDDGVKYQEHLDDAPEMTDGMSCEDFVIVFDADSRVAKKLSWEEVAKMVSGSVLKKHNELEGRDEINQHPITAILGLQSALDSKTTELNEAKNGLVKQIEGVDNSHKQIENTLSNRIASQENYFQSEVNRIDDFVFESVDDHENRIIKLEKQGGSGGGLSEDQLNNLNANTEARHTHDNADVLEKLTDDNGTLNYNNKPIGSSGSTSRPTECVDITFLEGELLSNTYTLGDGAAEIDPSLIGKEIADVEVVRADGNYYSIKNMSGIDYIPHITMLGYLHEGEVNGIPETVVAKIYFPAGVNWLYSELMSGAVTNARITYYTD